MAGDLGVIHELQQDLARRVWPTAPSPSTVSRTLAHLDAEKLLYRKVGARRALQLRALSGDGGPFAPVQPQKGRPPVVGLPRSLIDNGWIGALSLPELLVLLIGLAEQFRQFQSAGRRGHRGEWLLARSEAVTRYQISRATFGAGVRGLGTWGILQGNHPDPDQISPYLYEFDLAVLGGDPSRAQRYRGVKSTRTVRSDLDGKKIRLTAWTWVPAPSVKPPAR
jgi:hypothetical protein